MSNSWRGSSEWGAVRVAALAGDLSSRLDAMCDSPPTPLCHWLLRENTAVSFGRVLLLTCDLLDGQAESYYCCL